MSRTDGWVLARIPVAVADECRSRLRKLVDMLGWSLLDPRRDVNLVLVSVAAVSNLVAIGVRKEIIATIRERAEHLRKVGTLDDLIAAAELEDLIEDLEEPIRLAESR